LNPRAGACRANALPLQLYPGPRTGFLILRLLSLLAPRNLRPLGFHSVT
jgi:hypothetical protein